MHLLSLHVWHWLFADRRLALSWLDRAGLRSGWRAAVHGLLQLERYCSRAIDRRQWFHHVPRGPACRAGTSTRGCRPTIAAIRGEEREPCRARAPRLVAVGDPHLRTAIHDPAKLTAALDAYRRAATIAADQADTFLRQAIVLTALNRADDAARAVDRAVTIDARLGTDTTAALAAQQQLPPDPVFGDRPDAGPTTLASRSTDLLARIFREFPDGDGQAVAAVAGANWIADRWSRQWQGPERIDAVAAK